MRQPKARGPVAVQWLGLTGRKGNHPLAGAALLGCLMGANAGVAQGWTQTGAPSAAWSCVASSADGSRLAAAASPGLIYTSTNSGTTWNPSGAPSNYWYSIACSADGRKLVAGVALVPPWVYVSADSGATWRAPAIQALSAAYALVASSGDGSRLGAASCAWISFLFSADSGTTWREYDPGAAPISDAYCAIACSADGLKFKLLDDWAEAVLSLDSSVAGPGLPLAFGVPAFCSFIGGGSTSWGYYGGSLASSADAGTLVAVAKAFEGTGAVVVSTNAGATWAVTNTPVGTWSGVACSADASSMVAVAQDGTVLASTNAGAAWWPMAAPPENWSAVASSADGASLVAAANGGGIYTWQATPSPRLSIATAGTNIVVSWIIPSVSFTLQQSSDPGSTNWTSALVAPVFNSTNLQCRVTIPAPAGGTFYRLVSP